MCGWAARRCLEATLRVSRALVRTFLPFGAGSDLHDAHCVHTFHHFSDLHEAHPLYALNTLQNCSDLHEALLSKFSVFADFWFFHVSFDALTGIYRGHTR